LELDGFELDDFELVDLELVDFEVDSEVDEELDDESDEDFESDDLSESDPDDFVSLDDELSDLLDSLDEPLLDDFSRLSVLKNPEPLKLTPTGWKTFFTGIIKPDSGCANSDSVSSLNDCWTSTVSPVSTNL